MVQIDAIRKIQDQLEEYGKLIKVMEKSDIKDFSVIVSQGSFVCEQMLKVLIEEKGYYIDDMGMVHSQNQNVRGKMTPLGFVVSNKGFLPAQCANFVTLIRIYRNQAAHIKGIDYETAIVFAKALDYFTLWFDDYLTTHDMIGAENRKSFKLSLFSLEEALKKKSDSDNNLKTDLQNNDNKSILQILKDLDNTIKKLKTDLQNNDNKPNLQILDDLDNTLKKLKTDLQNNNDNKSNLQIPDDSDNTLKNLKTDLQNNDENLILQKLDEKTNFLHEYIKREVADLKAQHDKIGHKVDKVLQKIEELAGQIRICQSLVKRMKDNADSDEEVDRIMKAYADECSERIIKRIHSKAEQTNYENEKRKLVISLGENAWRKMEAASQTFLVSAKVMYSHLIELDDVIDYSGVCVLVTKALEVEMNKRFYTKFLEYLDKNYHSDYSKYPTALLYKKRAPLNPEKFTMGNIAYVLCYRENFDDSSIQKHNNKSKLLEYCKAKVFLNKTDLEINDMITKYAEDVEKIRTSYRNPSAHTDELKQFNAEECFNYVLDVEKVLQKMLESFAF